MRRRGRTAVLLAVLVSATLTGCSSAPTAAELEGAASAREAGLATLASIEMPALTDWTVAAVRNIDACGSQTSDTDFNEFHIGGYSCAAVRRTVYVLNDSESEGQTDAAALRAMTQLQSAFADAAETQDPPVVQLASSPPTAHGSLTVDGLAVRITAYVQGPAAIDIDLLPLWHINEAVGGDDGALHEKLGEIPRSAEFLTITTTVTYFEQSRAE